VWAPTQKQIRISIFFCTARIDVENAFVFSSAIMMVGWIRFRWRTLCYARYYFSNNIDVSRLDDKPRQALRNLARKRKNSCIFAGCF
jgi:hypothetical protein